MPMIHFLPLLPETSAPYTVPSSGSSSASSSRSSSISYTTGPSVHSLLGQIRTLTDSLNGGAVNHVEDIDHLNREVDYLSYFISAPLSLTPKLPGPSTIEVGQFNAAIRDLNKALAVYGDAGREGRGASNSSTANKQRQGRESPHRHKLSASHQRTEEENRLRLLRRYE
ncbi:hypothetical protein PVAG01_06353 [Phlyctema vagabunda]|uniref:Biogenesis of lysosome-related organelles complex 1 subunit 7 n=1 Tax=Phlyctema vagabunda TaxID=108571 RepID=A0ABR4PGH4_9HELO